MVKVTRQAALAAFLLASALVAMPAAAADKVVATVDGQTVTEAELAGVMQNMDQQLAKLPEGARKRAALDRMIDMHVLASAADKAGLKDDAEYKKQMEQMSRQMLVNVFVRTRINDVITEDMIKARYDKDIAGYQPPEELRARHVLVKTKEEADAVVKELDAGGDFAKIAEANSQDPGSAKQGGDLGYFGSGDMVPEFEAAAQALAIGAYTKTPVQTQFGFHVIKLEDKRKQKVPLLAEVHEQVKQAVVGERFTEILAGLKEKAKIDIDDAAIGGK